MTLILRTMKKHMGWDDAKDDHVILDGEKSVGRIYKEHGEAKWFWSVNTSPCRKLKLEHIDGVARPRSATNAHALFGTHHAEPARPSAAIGAF
jgi:hypothetical protein